MSIGVEVVKLRDSPMATILVKYKPTRLLLHIANATQTKRIPRIRVESVALSHQESCAFRVVESYRATSWREWNRVCILPRGV